MYKAAMKCRVGSESNEIGELLEGYDNFTFKNEQLL